MFSKRIEYQRVRGSLEVLPAVASLSVVSVLPPVCGLESGEEAGTAATTAGTAPAEETPMFGER